PTQNNGAGAVLFNLFFFGTVDSIYISYDTCKTWTFKKFPLTCMALSISNNNIIYAEGRTSKGPWFYQMYESLDSGTSWIPLGSQRAQDFSAIFPFQNKLLMCGNAGVFRCNTDGSDFTFVADIELLRNCLGILSDSQFLYINTWGNGIFRAKLEDVLNYTNGVNKPVQFENISLSLYPNPSEGIITIESAEPIIKIAVYDNEGKEIRISQENIRMNPNGARI